MSGGTKAAALAFRQDYFADHAAWRALVSLLHDTFGIDIGPLMELGGPDPSSMPFGWFAGDGTLAANLSAFAMPIVLNGRRINAAALQSGAVRPPWRRRGLYRDVTTKALDWCQAQGFAAIVLYTDKPALYEPYGFRTLPMHSFEGDAPKPDGAADARTLDPRLAADLALLQDLLARREAVSDTLAVISSPAMFLINTQLDPDVRLTFIEKLDAVIAWKLDGERFILLDVLAPSIPSLAAIFGGLGIKPSRAEILFRPDKLGWNGAPLPSSSHGTHFMIRGLDGLQLQGPAMLSPMADF
jgi:predicted N-acetyltransferase YhbS